MKKKIFLLSIIAIILVCVLAGCTKDFSVSKKGHDSILDATDTTYIAIDGGKSYLYSIKNSKKLTKNGFDKLEYIDSSSIEYGSYLIAYNSGDIGYSVVNGKGNPLIVSTTDMKITNVRLIQDITFDAGIPQITDRLISVNFVNNENMQRSAAFRLDGTAIFYYKNGEVNYHYSQSEIDDTTVLEYVMGGTTEIVNDVMKLSRFEVFDNTLISIYAQSFNDSIIFNGINFTTNSLGYINYRTVADEVFTDHMDIFAGGKAYIGYTSLDNTLDDEYFNTSAYVVSKNNPETNINSYSLIGKQGVLKTFDTYSKSNNNILIPEGETYNIFNYLGASILSNASLGGMNHYKVIVGDTALIYNIKGQKLFETNKDNTIFDFRGTYSGKVVEYFEEISTGNEISYKFFMDGMLVKEYGPSYELEARINDIVRFSTKNEQGVKNYFYNYCFSSNVETVVAANIDGNMDVAVEGNVLLPNGEWAYYYAQKESKDIVFYSGLIGKITPYTGDKVPSYSVEGGNYSFKRIGISYEDTIYTCLSLVYEALTKIEIPNTMPQEYKYESNQEILYAYYLMDGMDLGCGLYELYSGHNMANIYAEDEYEVIVASTVDKFADEFDSNQYASFENLADKTRVFKVVQDKETLKLSLTLTSEFAASNIEPETEKYLIGEDFSNGFGTNSVYKYDGTLVLTAKYEVRKIVGDLALVSITSSSGVYNLEKGKLLEDVKYAYINVQNPNMYSVGKITDNGIMTTFKDANGKKITGNCNHYEPLSITYNFNEGTITESYIIYLGKGKMKLMTVTYSVPNILNKDVRNKA